MKQFDLSCIYTCRAHVKSTKTSPINRLQEALNIASTSLFPYVIGTINKWLKRCCVTRAPYASPHFFN